MPVATFSRAIKLKFGGHKNFVDAAIAAVEPGQVSPEIMFIGGIASTLATPTIGLAVQKMGCTSCLTTGVIAALDANVTVNYSDTKKPHLASFVNQVLVTGSIATPTFSGPGDSGSLIVTRDICPLAVALLFAGSADGHRDRDPISAVTSKLGVSMVGSCTAAPASDAADPNAVAGNVGVSQEAVAMAASVRDRHESQLISIAGAAGTGIELLINQANPRLKFTSISSRPRRRWRRLKKSRARR